MNGMTLEGVWPRGMLRRALLIASACAVAAGVLGLLFAPRWSVLPGRLEYALLGSTGFLAVAMAAGALRAGYGRWMLGGLAWCWVGDITGLLVSFEVSALAFLVGHLFFMAAFYQRGIALRPALAMVPPVALVSLVTFAWLRPYLGAGDLPLVMAYVLVISAMVACAGGTAHNRAGLLIVAGAVIFYVSDIFVARWAYVGGGNVNAYFCYPLYYTACFLLALAAGTRPPESWGTPAGGVDTLRTGSSFREASAGETPRTGQ